MPVTPSPQSTQRPSHHHARLLPQPLLHSSLSQLVSQPSFLCLRIHCVPRPPLSWAPHEGRHTGCSLHCTCLWHHAWYSDWKKEVFLSRLTAPPGQGLCPGHLSSLRPATGGPQRLWNTWPKVETLLVAQSPAQGALPPQNCPQRAGPSPGETPFHRPCSPEASRRVGRQSQRSVLGAWWCSHQPQACRNRTRCGELALYLLRRFRY